jgi:hypothetical protein
LQGQIARAGQWQKATAYRGILGLATFEDRLLAAVGQTRLTLYGSLVPPDLRKRRKRKPESVAA